jgi:hypothetical protein
MGCGRCITRKPATGGRRWLHLGWVCEGCDSILRGTSSTAAGHAGVPKVTHCPAKGIAAGYDPRTQLPPGAAVTGFFTQDWLAKRRATA